MAGIGGGIGRNGWRLALGAVMIAAIVAALLWLQQRSRWVYSTDARIKATMIGVSSEVRGTVVRVPVEIGARVSAGAVLLQLDDREALFHLAELEAALAALEAETAMIRTRRTQTAAVGKSRLAERRAERIQAEATLRAAMARHVQAKRHEARARALQDRGVMSEELNDEALTRLAEARQALDEARARLIEIDARIDEAQANLLETDVIDRQLDVLARRHDEMARRIDRQQVVVERHSLRAPLAGVVDEVFLDVGEQALPGFRAALIHDPDDVWVEANIKETNIDRIRLAAPVRVRVDAYPGSVLDGRVTRIRDVATGEFALLPNPNATGIFTKITQRVPVRITLEETDLVLRPGTMVTLEIAAGRDR